MGGVVNGLDTTRKAVVQELRPSQWMLLVDNEPAGTVVASWLVNFRREEFVIITLSELHGAL